MINKEEESTDPLGAPLIVFVVFIISLILIMVAMTGAKKEGPPIPKFNLGDIVYFKLDNDKCIVTDIQCRVKEKACNIHVDCISRHYYRYDTGPYDYLFNDTPN